MNRILKGTSVSRATFLLMGSRGVNTVAASRYVCKHGLEHEVFGEWELLEGS